MELTPNQKVYQVRAVHCDYQSSDEEIFEALKRATLPLTAAWDKLHKARRIAIKFNQDFVPGRIRTFHGERTQLVSDSVARAVIRLLKENTNAELFAIDIGIEGIGAKITDGSSTNLMPIFREANLPFIDANLDRTVWVDVPGGGIMFDRYPIPQTLSDVDALVDVQKLKNHLFMGVTLTLKNLFAFASILPVGRPRAYYHHLLRMSYLLTDLGRIFQPTLNIIDGLVTQAGAEWEPSTYPRICNTLVAGDHPVATDACGTYLMGHDPRGDWPNQPFLRDRNPLLVAHQHGYGTADLSQIDFQSEVTSPVGEFFCVQPDKEETTTSWRYTTAEKGLYYYEHRKELIDKYANQYILLQMGEVRWADPSGNLNVSRRILAGDHPEQGMYLKFVDPDEMEGEHFEVYQQTLDMMNKK